MISSLTNIILQSLEILSPENKKKLISALTIFQIMTLYILTFQIYYPWFSSILAMIAFLSFLYCATKKQTDISLNVNFFEFLIDVLEEFEHDFGIDILAKKDEMVKRLAESALDLVHQGHINAKKIIYVPIVKAFQYYPFFFLVAVLSDYYLGDMVSNLDWHTLIVMYVTISIVLLLLRVRLHTLVSLSMDKYGPVIGSIVFIVLAFLLAIFPQIGIENLLSLPEPRYLDYIIRYRAHLSSQLNNETKKFFEELISNPYFIIYHWSSHTIVNRVKKTKECILKDFTERLDMIMKCAELTTVDIYRNIYIIGNQKSGDASIVIFRIIPKTRVSSYDKLGNPKRQIVEYYLLISEVAIGKSLIADIISKISKESP
ncbi:hypothetical protein [Thermococcus sp.]|uniref:hypothetical protein n=1 Tax=Thermococcus sp. TaxID=35749 RepID=UPI00260B65BE|nr:hypothetical protein [Thermococcus sp.]